MSAITKALRKALEADPSNWETRQALVESLVQDGQADEALSLIRGLEVAPNDERHLISTALSFAKSADREGGRKVIQGVLDRNPGNVDAHLALATLAHAAGDAKTATKHFVMANTLDPSVDAPELESAYGAVLDSIGLRSAPAAEEPAAVAVQAYEEPEPVAFQAIEEPEPVVIPAPVPLSPPPSLASGPVKSEPKEEEKAAPVQKSAPKPMVVEDDDDEPVAHAVAVKEAIASPAISVPTLINAPRFEEQADESLDLGSGPPVIIRERRDGEGEGDEFEGDHLAEEVKHLRDEIEAKRRWMMARDKMTSLTVTVLLHVVAFVLLTLAVVSTPFRDAPPQLVAQSVVADRVEDIKQTTLNKNQVKQASSAASPSNDFIAATGASSIAMAPSEVVGEIGVGTAVNAEVGMDFTPSVSFGDAAQSMNSKMLFGQKLDIKGDLLGVILDVSGSMAEYLPFVVKEIDRNFKNAPIVYVNHAGMVGTGKDSEIYPIIPEEVLPSWPKAWNKGTTSPFWFLWGDLPRKAEQRHVDRLIETFKTRPNMFIARGGNNRVGAAAKFLDEQKVDGLYIFSDFADFVDSEFCDNLGRSLGRSKVRTYVQPVDAARTDHFAVVVKEVANRSLGRELPPLTELLRPGDLEPIAVEVKKELPVPAGVAFATPRKQREVDPLLGYNYNRWWWDDNSKVRFKDELKVVEYPNFDIVIWGPEARAALYLKNDAGDYIQSPIVFGYRSVNPYKDETDGKWYYPRRKWLRNAEEPKFDGNEFSWKMILEDEILFEVIFWFKEDTVTATYVAERPPNGEGDSASIFFSIPPTTIERKDTYFSPDFPEGLDLDNLRMAMAHNTATFYLPVQAEATHGTAWSRLGFKKGENVCPYNVLYRNLPDAVREVTIGGKSFGTRRLQARTTSNNLLLSTGAYRADLELFEGFAAVLARPNDRRERVAKTEAIAFSIE